MTLIGHGPEKTVRQADRSKLSFESEAGINADARGCFENALIFNEKTGFSALKDKSTFKEFLIISSNEQVN